MMDCVNVATPTDPLVLLDKSKACDAYGKIAACNPKCYCDDTANKAALDVNKKQVETLGCTFKCGTSSGLRASAFTVFIAAAVSMVSAR
jgi:hypothetical protein